ncbi:MAG TPA: hypothetical protein VGD43_13810 [Micromonospora sp.]
MSTVTERCVTHAPYGNAQSATRQPRHTGQPEVPGGRLFTALGVSNSGIWAFAQILAVGVEQNVQGYAHAFDPSESNNAATSGRSFSAFLLRPLWVGFAFG